MNRSRLDNRCIKTPSVYNNTFWKTGKPQFSDKMNTSHKMTLINENKISSKNSEVAEILNE